MNYWWLNWQLCSFMWGFAYLEQFAEVHTDASSQQERFVLYLLQQESSFWGCLEEKHGVPNRVKRKWAVNSNAVFFCDREKCLEDSFSQQPPPTPSHPFQFTKDEYAQIMKMLKCSTVPTHGRYNFWYFWILLDSGNWDNWSYDIT